MNTPPKKTKSNGKGKYISSAEIARRIALLRKKYIEKIRKLKKHPVNTKSDFLTLDQMIDRMLLDYADVIFLDAHDDETMKE